MAALTMKPQYAGAGYLLVPVAATLPNLLRRLAFTETHFNSFSEVS